MLPEGYTKIEYIQNAAPGSYFNIGIVPTIATRVMFDGMTMDGDTALFGARTTQNASDKFTLQYISSGLYRISFQNVQKNAPATYTKGIRHFFDVGREGMFIDGYRICDLPAPELKGQLPFYVLACNTGNAMSNPGINRIYSMQVYEDDVLISNLIPCKNPQSEVGLYDTEREIFLSNAGLGQFVGKEEELICVDVTRLPDKTAYYLGEELDTTGMVVTAKYASGYKQRMTDYGISSFNPLKPGAQTISVFYAGFVSTFKVTVYSEEPPKDVVSLAEMKQYLRVDFKDDDALIENFILTAKRLCMDVLRCDDDAVLTSLPNGKTAVLYTVAYLYEHREEADHHKLVLVLRALLFGGRKAVF